MSEIQSIPDLVAFAGQRRETILESGFTRDEFVAAVKETVLAAGWTVWSTRADSFGAGYVFRSQQSPWYDCENIPPWYVGNEMYLDLDNNDTFIRFYLGAFNNGTPEGVQTSSPFLIQISLITNHRYSILANPYQLICQYLDVPNASSGRMQFLVSAINLPKSVLQKNQVVHGIIGTSRWDGQPSLSAGAAAANDHYIWKERGGAVISQTGQLSPPFNIISIAGPTGHAVIQGRRIWNRLLDPTMTDPTQWAGFFSAPYFLWKHSDESRMSIKGFLWDALVITEAFSRHAVMDIASNFDVRRFRHYFGATSSTQASLWFNIDNNPEVEE